MKSGQTPPAPRAAVGANLDSMAGPHVPSSPALSSSGPLPFCSSHISLLKSLSNPPCLLRSAFGHHPSATICSHISNLKSQIPPSPSSFSLSQIPSRSPKDLSRKLEYPPSSRNIPPYPRISPPPILVRNQFQHNDIHHNASNPPKMPTLIINHLRLPRKTTTARIRRRSPHDSRCRPRL